MTRQQVQTKNEMKIIECCHCLTPYPVPISSGCSICPTCGQKSCSD